MEALFPSKYNPKTAHYAVNDDPRQLAHEWSLRQEHASLLEDYKAVNSEESRKKGPLPRALPPDQVAPAQQTDDSPKSLRTLLFSRYKATVSHETIAASLLDHCRRQEWSVKRVTPSPQWRGRIGERYVVGQCFHVFFANIEATKAALAHFTNRETASHFDQWATEDRGHAVEPSVDIHRNRPNFGADQRHIDRYWE